MSGQIAEDAKAELDKVLFSDFLITVSPVWWGT
jgi:putative NADPH-quinone reductase